ncbi:hypothetical protein ACFX13_030541 [Malus domestica]
MPSSIVPPSVTLHNVIESHTSSSSQPSSTSVHLTPRASEFSSINPSASESLASPTIAPEFLTSSTNPIQSQSSLSAPLAPTQSPIPVDSNFQQESLSVVLPVPSVSLHPM